MAIDESVLPGVLRGVGGAPGGDGRLLLVSMSRIRIREQLNAIFRAAHSIRESAGTFGFSIWRKPRIFWKTCSIGFASGNLACVPRWSIPFLNAVICCVRCSKPKGAWAKSMPGAVATICARLRELSSDRPGPWTSPSGGGSRRS